MVKEDHWVSVCVGGGKQLLYWYLAFVCALNALSLTSLAETYSRSF